MQETFAGSIPELERSLGGGTGNPLQYSCLGNPMDRGAWQAAVHGDVKIDINTDRYSYVLWPAGGKLGTQKRWQYKFQFEFKCLRTGRANGVSSSPKANRLSRPRKRIFQFWVQRQEKTISLVKAAQLCLTLATPWTAACQAPLSMEFSRQEYWSGLPCPSPGDLPNPGTKPKSPTL